MNIYLTLLSVNVTFLPFSWLLVLGIFFICNLSTNPQPHISLCHQEALLGNKMEWHTDLQDCSQYLKTEQNYHHRLQCLWPDAKPPKGKNAMSTLKCANNSQSQVEIVPYICFLVGGEWLEVYQTQLPWYSAVYKLHSKILAHYWLSTFRQPE